MYTDEERAIILATQARTLGIVAIIFTFLLFFPISMICCVDGYYKVKKAKSLAPWNDIVKSGYKIINIARWALIIVVTVISLSAGIIVFVNS